MNPPTTPVLWRVDNGIGHIVLNRPETANAIDLAFAQAFDAPVEQAAQANVGAVLLSSTGRQYCAGGDIQAFMARQRDVDAFVGELLDILDPAMLRLAELPLPVASAVQGPVGGAGIALALCADIVLASTAMKLRGGYSAIGLVGELHAEAELMPAAHALATSLAVGAKPCCAAHARPMAVKASRPSWRSDRRGSMMWATCRSSPPPENGALRARTAPLR